MKYGYTRDRAIKELFKGPRIVLIAESQYVASIQCVAEAVLKLAILSKEKEGSEGGCVERTILTRKTTTVVIDCVEDTSSRRVEISVRDTCSADFVVRCFLRVGAIPFSPRARMYGRSMWQVPWNQSLFETMRRNHICILNDEGRPSTEIPSDCSGIDEYEKLMYDSIMQYCVEYGGGLFPRSPWKPRRGVKTTRKKDWPVAFLFCLPQGNGMANAILCEFWSDNLQIMGAGLQIAKRALRELGCQRKAFGSSVQYGTFKGQ